MRPASATYRPEIDGLRALAVAAVVAGFYERRVRRIAPALVFMLAAKTVFACAAFVPAELERYARSLLATAAFASNLYFYASGTGYFDREHSKILLYTWSLDVEEQFYLVMPWAMTLAARRRLARRHAIRVAALASFALACLDAQHRDLAFYAPHLRAWELLLGAFLACGVPSVTSRLAREAMGQTALAWIAESVAEGDGRFLR